MKAIQHSDGSWAPHTSDGKKDSPRLPWGRAALNEHLAGTKTFGHYMLDTDSTCKLFAFDIDLEKNKAPIDGNPGFQGYWVDDEGTVHAFDPRVDWQNRAHPSRNWSKYQLKMVATRFAAKITEELEIPCAVAYSGGKGVHVYGFTGKVPAIDAREGADLVLESVGGWEATRGNNFFKTTDRSPETGYPNLCIEVFPKQETLDRPEALGNLMRLPLGRNLKSPDPTFFIDMTSPMGVMKPVDPVFALTTPSPWKSPND